MTPKNFADFSTFMAMPFIVSLDSILSMRCVKRTAVVFCVLILNPQRSHQAAMLFKLF